MTRFFIRCTGPRITTLLTLVMVVLFVITYTDIGSNNLKVTLPPQVVSTTASVRHHVVALDNATNFTVVGTLPLPLIPKIPAPAVVYICFVTSNRPTAWDIVKLLFPVSDVQIFTDKLAYGRTPVENNSLMVAFWPRPRCQQYTGRVLLMNGESHDALFQSFGDNPNTVSLGSGASFFLPSITWAVNAMSGLNLTTVVQRLLDNPGANVYNKRFLR